MVTVRSAKAKGSAMEYDTQYSLLALYPDIYLTKQRGFQQQIDLISEEHKIAIECKRTKSLSWNTMVKFYKKLKEVSPEDYTCYLIFKTNQQPCLVYDGYGIKRFDSFFAVPFQKHEPIRRKNEQSKES